MSSRDRWLEAGSRILARAGIADVTIARLCADVGLSKGSFYHHFRGISGYHVALLEYFRERETDRYVRVAEGGDSSGAGQRLRRLMDAVTVDGEDTTDLERAVRVWAAQEPLAAKALEHIDRSRTAYLEVLLDEVTGSPDEARDLARVIYLILLGSFYALPPEPMADVRRLWERVLASVL